jgi:hypothetical protein
MDRLLAAFRNVRGKMTGTMEGIAQHYVVPSLQFEGCTLDHHFLFEFSDGWSHRG